MKGDSQSNRPAGRVGILVIVGFVVVFLAAIGLPGCSRPISGGDYARRQFAESEARIKTLKKEIAAEDRAAPKPMKSFHIPNFQHITALELDAFLGKPVQVTAITNTPDQMPGEFREYGVEGDPTVVMARLFQGKLVMMQVHTKETYLTAARALDDFGIDVKSVSPTKEVMAGEVWNGKVGPETYKSLEVFSKTSDSKDGFNIIQVEWEKPQAH